MSHRPPLGLSLALLVLAQACNGPTLHDPSTASPELLPLGARATAATRTRVIVPAEFVASTVVDVVVAPVEFVPGVEADADLSILRRALWTGLPDRLFAPLALEYVDRGWQEASAGSPGSELTPLMGADALLQVSVLRWQRRGERLRIEVRVQLLGADGEAAPLWDLELAREFPLAQRASRKDYVGEALVGMAEVILQLLPERDVGTVEALPSTAVDGDS